MQRFKRQSIDKRLKVIKNFANQILKGLAYLHGRSPPVIHRDLKCDNVFVTGQCGQVKIGDLGLATLKKTSFAKSVIGTPEFMAPEMYSEEYDESIDVYAFGMCLLEMYTGEYPYKECTKPFDIYRRVTGGIRPENYNRIDSDDLRELIDLCIRLKKIERPTVKELVNHSWFMDNNGLRLEVHQDEKKKIMHTDEAQVTFRLKVTDKAKRKLAWPDNEEIEFMYNVDTDDPVNVANEIRENSGKIGDEDLKYLIQAIKNKCEVFKLERLDRLDKINEEEKNHPVQKATNSTSSSSSTVTTATTNLLPSGVSTGHSTSTITTTTTTGSTLTRPSGTTTSSSTVKTLTSELSNINNNNELSINEQQSQIAPSNSSTLTAPLNANSTTNQQQDDSNDQQPSTITDQSIIFNNNNQAAAIAATTTITTTAPSSSAVIFADNNNILNGKTSSSPIYEKQQNESNISNTFIISNVSKNNNTNNNNHLEETTGKLLTKSELKELKFTIQELYEKPETGEVVNCKLEIDDKETINFKFGLNADSPEDITSRLMNASNRVLNDDFKNQVIETIKNVIKYINQNKNTLSIQNQQFSTIINSANKEEVVKQIKFQFISKLFIWISNLWTKYFQK
jgi:serine/threonine protein kinase